MTTSVSNHEIELETIEDEGGKTQVAHHTVTLSSGAVYQYGERSIFDVGVAINPEYALIPGAKPGGIYNRINGAEVWEMWRAPQYRDRNVALGEYGLPASWRVVHTHAPQDDPQVDFPRQWYEYEIYDADNDRVSAAATLADAVAKAQKCMVDHPDVMECIDEGGWWTVRALTNDERVAYHHVAGHGIYPPLACRM